MISAYDLAHQETVLSEYFNLEIERALDAVKDIDQLALIDRLLKN